MSTGLYGVNPRRDCKPPMRHPACHANCIEYKAWKDDVDKRKSQYMDGKSTEAMLDNVEKKRLIWRSKRRHNK